jgi:hypothetical protein
MLMRKGPLYVSAIPKRGRIKIKWHLINELIQKRY